MKKKIKCVVCGERFTPIAAERYTTIRDNQGTGLLGSFGSNTPAEYYDTFDCPSCGSQIRVGVRLPILNEEITGRDEDIDNKHFCSDLEEQ